MNQLFKEERDFIMVMLATPEEERENTIETNFTLFLPSLPQGEYKVKVLKEVWQRYLKRNVVGSVIPELTEEEAGALNKISNTNTRKKMHSLIIWKKLHPHPGGWIKLEWPECMRFDFSEREIEKMRIEDLAELRQYGFDCRVIGSKNPILCYDLFLGENYD